MSVVSIQSCSRALFLRVAGWQDLICDEFFFFMVVTVLSKGIA